MSITAQVADLLVQRLTPHGFARENRPPPTADIAETVVLKTERRRFMRYLCVVVSVPNAVQSADDIGALHSKLRRILSRHYAQFPWYKELGTFAIYLCEPHLFASLRTLPRRTIDKTRFHMNVMLAAWIVNSVTFDSMGKPTWGLLSHAGQAVGAIGGALAELRSRHVNQSQTA